MKITDTKRAERKQRRCFILTASVARVRFQRRGKLCRFRGGGKKKKKKKERKSTDRGVERTESEGDGERRRERQREGTRLVLGEVVCTRVERKINFPRVPNEFHANRSRTIFSLPLPFPESPLAARCANRWCNFRKAKPSSRNYYSRELLMV